MKKKTIANIVMAAIILVIVAAGILTVGHIQGWFDSDDGTQAVLCDMQGVINLERDGVSYPVESKTVLRQGDKITCNSGACAVIRVGEDSLAIGEKSVVTVADSAVSSFAADVSSGEVFVNFENAAVLRFGGQDIAFAQTTALLSVHGSTQSISVFRGKVEEAVASQMLSFVDGQKSILQLDIKTLNDFTITQLCCANETTTLCFTNEDLDRLAADRQAAMQELIDSQTKLPETETTAPTEETTAPTVTVEPTQPTQGSTVTTQPTTPVESTTPPETTAPPETTSPPETTTPSTALSCTITIRCDTILNNMDNLKAGKAEFVPSDGCVLYPVTVEFTEGETVFDVLKRVCSITGIQLEYSMSSYGSYYIEGIHNLYEFDCGGESGWMYKVNGWFPNYGCSDYTLKNGDVIVWAYTCQGLGTDIGAPSYS